MDDNLKKIAEDATNEIDGLLKSKLTDDQWARVEKIIEETVIRALLEGQHRAVDAALNVPEADRDLAHKFASAIRQKNDALIVNLSSMR